MADWNTKKKHCVRHTKKVNNEIKHTEIDWENIPKHIKRKSIKKVKDLFSAIEIHLIFSEMETEKLSAPKNKHLPIFFTLSQKFRFKERTKPTRFS